ncbi:hypothetical protein [Lacisediminihabitans changchengi]|uniref:Uncharacterized protein n=1 Tax=Lacisediminihabitans changchengi TaxID=2787634 RepID=A0A934SMW7_9MICO|nr:hypothetical protein [Lacisediminihabitans changchengi]MBK4346940.1 hypothetical protein [Lacisediminihabitans changchengi]MBK4347937.1 hypothetical protein [Lacisediminihabitans changchengi]
MSDQKTPEGAQDQSATAQSATELYGDGSIPQDADFTDPASADDPVEESILDELPDGGGAEGEPPAGSPLP